MKSIFLRLGIFTVFLFNAFSIFAQSKHTVTVQSFSFTPSTLTINLGDTVEFINISGSHNVNGNQNTFPNNPQSFGNNVGSGWNYKFKFTAPGSYGYHCDPHQGNMMGSITVLNNASTLDLASSKLITVYPNPVSETLNINLPDDLFAKQQHVSVTIFNIIGKKLASEDVSSGKRVQFDVSDYPKGIYLYQINSQTGILKTGKITVK